MRMPIRIAFGLAFLSPALAAAQDKPKFEVIASAAMGHVFRFEDQGFGNHPNFGLGVELPVWRKLRFGAEINRTFGLTPRPARCGSILNDQRQPLPCIGTARTGVSAAMAGSLAAFYYFGNGRIQPYLLGGISFMKATEYQASSFVRRDIVEFQESKSSSAGIGPTLGAGLRASITRRLSIRPEIRFSDGTSLSSLNLSQWRISLGPGYGW